MNIMKTYQKPLLQVVTLTANTVMAALVPTFSEIELQDDSEESGE